MLPTADPDFDPPFEILEPQVLRAPVVFNSPHSGSHYPRSFLAATRLDPLTLRRSEDAFVDELFLGTIGLGAPLMRAHFPRAFLDLNREPYELDPRMFDGRLPSHANTRSLRVAGGLGTIARVVGDSQEIYARRLPIAEVSRRVDGLYKPYHAALDRLLHGVRVRCGMAVLVDCHSMPSSGIPRDERPRADIVLGDRYGTSAAPEFVDLAEASLRALGFSVTRNRPYAGGFITEHYGNPVSGRHALQIEINRALYMDEARHEKLPCFDDMARLMTQFSASFLAFAGMAASPGRLAAE